MTHWGHYLDVTLCNIKLSLMVIIEYPANIIGWLISNPIQFIIGFATIKFAVAQFGEINGWNYGQLAFLYGLSVISHAISMMFFVQGWFMGYSVIEGEFDRFLTRPMGVLYQFFFTNFNIFGITDLIPGIVVFIYGCIETGFRFSFSNAIGIIVMLIGAALIRGGLYIMLGSTSFWTKTTTDTSVTLDISLKLDGKDVQPNGTVTVKIKKPDKLSGDKFYVYHVETDESYTDMHAEYSDGFIIFKTDHFSKYIISTVQLSESAEVTTTTTTAENTENTGNTEIPENTDNANSDDNMPTGNKIAAIIPIIAFASGITAAIAYNKRRK